MIPDQTSNRRCGNTALEFPMGLKSSADEYIHIVHDLCAIYGLLEVSKIIHRWRSLQTPHSTGNKWSENTAPTVLRLYRLTSI